MADLVVHPSIVVGPEDIITADLLNLLATPVVDLALETPVNDQNFLRNGNFYSSFWTTPSGLNCPVNVETSNANYWYTKPQGAAVTTKRATLVPDTNSLFSHEVDGAVGVTSVEFGQNISGDLSATLRRVCTFSGNIFNNTGLTVSPNLEIYTANVFNNFTAKTLQKTINLQSCANGLWTFVSATIDLSTLANVANGVSVVVIYPTGTLLAGKSVNHSRMKFQIGEVATEFTDDVSLFVQAPSVDSTMLQDGCIARPSLFLSEVIPSAAYQAGSVLGEDIAAGTITAANLSSTAVTGSLGYTPVNKAGDTMTGSLHAPLLLIAGKTTNAQVYLSNDPAGSTKDTLIIYKQPNDTYARTYYVDPTNTGLWSGWLLDSHHGVDNSSYQAGSITYDKLAQSLINLVCPVGMIICYAGPNVPSGFFVCDGSWVSRASWPALFGAIGTYWGVADGTTYFALPDLRGRAPIGYVNTGSPSGITARGFGSYGGEESTQLAGGHLPSHAHSIPDQQHVHGLHNDPHSHTYVNPIGSTGAQPGSGQYSAVGVASTNAVSITMSMDYAYTGINATSAYGSNVAHNTLQPFAVCYYLIKAM